MRAVQSLLTELRDRRPWWRRLFTAIAAVVAVMGVSAEVRAYQITTVMAFKDGKSLYEQCAEPTSIANCLRCWCDRRAVKLYQRGYGFYRCRRYLHLAYPCEREDACDRAFRRVAKIRTRLGGSPEWGAPFPPKPKDMWQRTYERLWYRLLEAEERAEMAFKL